MTISLSVAIATIAFAVIGGTIIAIIAALYEKQPVSFGHPEESWACLYIDRRIEDDFRSVCIQFGAFRRAHSWAAWHDDPTYRFEFKITLLALMVYRGFDHGVHDAFFGISSAAWTGRFRPIIRIGWSRCWDFRWHWMPE